MCDVKCEIVFSMFRNVWCEMWNCILMWNHILDVFESVLKSSFSIMFPFRNGNRKVLSEPSSKRLNRWFSHLEVSMRDEAALSSKASRLHSMNCFSALLDVSDTIIDSFGVATICSRSAEFPRSWPSLTWRKLTWPNMYISKKNAHGRESRWQAVAGRGAGWLYCICFELGASFVAYQSRYRYNISVFSVSGEPIHRYHAGVFGRKGSGMIPLYLDL